MTLPRIAITMGDPTGVGPEVIVKAWKHEQVHAICRPIVVGHPEVLARAAQLAAPQVEVIAVAHGEDIVPSPALLPCLTACGDDALLAPPRAIDPRGGQAAYEALTSATRMALAGSVDAITTAPLNKAALWAAGHHYPGHTELLAELCGVTDFAMLLYLAPQPASEPQGGLGVIHVTLHTALALVFEQLSVSGIESKIRLADRTMVPLVGRRPRIGVCALNPHAGEDGLFGNEERILIRPAVEAAAREGVQVSGPWPADSLFVRAKDGEFDAVVAMYHDQGHIALKLLGMQRAVNVTLGLPIVRTSVAHGTAFDLAWKGLADERGMIEALAVAARLVLCQG